MTGWTFNGNYKDLDQVAEFWPAYLARYEELAAAHRYPYNDDFRGHMGAVEGKAEMTAIYLCQTRRALDEHNAKVAARLADGWRELDRAAVTVTPQRFAGVVEHGFCMGGTGWNEWEGARLLTATEGRTVFVMAKGARTRGHIAHGQLLVKD